MLNFKLQMVSLAPKGKKSIERDRETKDREQERYQNLKENKNKRQEDARRRGHQPIMTLDSPLVSNSLDF